MKSWQRYSLFVSLALLAAYGGYSVQQVGKQEPMNTTMPTATKSAEDMIGLQPVNFTLADANGDMRQLSEWQGKVVALNFWATWCPPCREEIPDFIKLQQRYEADGLQFVGIALQTAAEIQEFIAEYQLNYPSLVGEQDVMALAKELGNGIGALPYTVIIDRSGIIQFTRKGTLSKAEAEAVITGLL
jgi:peroxiredoxin